MSTRKLLKYASASDCPDAARLHTPAPSGYLAWHDWADGMLRTHAPKRCPTCGYWAVWVPRKGRVAS